MAAQVNRRTPPRWPPVAPTRRCRWRAGGENWPDSRDEGSGGVGGRSGPTRGPGCGRHRPHPHPTRPPRRSPARWHRRGPRSAGRGWRGWRGRVATAGALLGGQGHGHAGARSPRARGRAMVATTATAMRAAPCKPSARRRGQLGGRVRMGAIDGAGLHRHRRQASTAHQPPDPEWRAATRRARPPAAPAPGSASATGRGCRTPGRPARKGLCPSSHSAPQVVGRAAGGDDRAGGARHRDQRRPDRDRAWPPTAGSRPRPPRPDPPTRVRGPRPPRPDPARAGPAPAGHRLRAPRAGAGREKKAHGWFTPVNHHDASNDTRPRPGQHGQGLAPGALAQPSGARHPQQHRRPHQVELLLHPQRPVPLERRGGGHRQVAGVGQGEADVGHEQGTGQPVAGHRRQLERRDLPRQATSGGGHDDQRGRRAGSAEPDGRRRTAKPIRSWRCSSFQSRSVMRNPDRTRNTSTPMNPPGEPGHPGVEHASTVAMARQRSPSMSRRKPMARAQRVQASYTR